MNKQTKIFHSFKTSISDIQLPEAFTYPFCYTPHPLSILAANEVQEYLAKQTEWKVELSKGKMFGVLIVSTPQKEIGYLAAFSGILAGKNIHPFFVPPVYDLLNPSGFFKIEEEKISAINHQIEKLEKEEKRISLKEAVKRTKENAAIELDAAKQNLKVQKAYRDKLRKEQNLTSEEKEKLIHDSQYQKASYKRLTHHWEEAITQAEKASQPYEDVIDRLKEERKEKSAALQQKLFAQFQFLNYKGEKRDLCSIFADTVQRIPPAGAGECAAPKLLQFAYLHHYMPLAMAEFWWGNSPKSEIRKHGHFYPSCTGKCLPILSHMLQGLKVEPNPLHNQHTDTPLKIIYEDDYLIIVNKPSGMLSVPGKGHDISVYSLMKAKYPQAEEPLMVHRLDQSTSGLLIITKKKIVNQALQALFSTQKVEKRYIAILKGIVKPNEGKIELPLSPDYIHRPQQKVDYEHGKTAITLFKVLQRNAQREETRIAFYPLTGRTHQLRIHAAHPEGLDCPIKGDELYGEKDKRLYLHAEYLKFEHPIFHRTMEFTVQPTF